MSLAHEWLEDRDKYRTLVQSAAEPTIRRSNIGRDWSSEFNTKHRQQHALESRSLHADYSTQSSPRPRNRRQRRRLSRCLKPNQEKNRRRRKEISVLSASCGSIHSQTACLTEDSSRWRRGAELRTTHSIRQAENIWHSHKTCEKRGSKRFVRNGLRLVKEQLGLTWHAS